MAHDTSVSDDESAPGPYELAALAEEHLTKARGAAHGRSAHLVLRDGPLRQSVLALTAGSALGEHEAPIAATLQVLHGRVRVTAVSGKELTLSVGELGLVPGERHDLVAEEDSVVILTTVTAGL
ncbi:cupin [Streptomyces boluensis]|uniref:Cupin n=1 Tax=Streptomyces boluensis TaxID=1775135 RepID=A0A964UKN7_9ACTN|nr:cupin [Streptomyces boluensis]NBE50969.1 cupin [Streptomyces boluensis]